MKPRNKFRTKNREKSSTSHPIEPVIEFPIQDGVKLVSTARIIARERELDKLEQRVKEKRLKLEEMMAKLSCPKKSDSVYKRQRGIRHYSPIYDEPRPRRTAPVEFANADNHPYERSAHDPYGYNNFPPPSRPSSPFYSYEQFDPSPHTTESSMWDNSWNYDNCGQTFGDPVGSWNYWDDFDYGEPHINESFQRSSDLGPWSSTINIAQDEWNEPRVSSTYDVLPRTKHQERIRNRNQRTLLEPKREGSQVRGQYDLPLERSCIRTERGICSVCQLPGHPASVCQPK